MIDYKFSEPSKVDPTYKKLVETLKNPELAEVVKAFASNIDRMVCFADFSIDVIDLSIAYTGIAAEACLKLTGKPEIEEKHIHENPKMLEQLQQEMQTSMADWAKKELADPSHTARGRARAAQQLNHFIALYPPVATAVQSIFAAVLTTLWTSFETLSNDLWVAALNAQPTGLADLTGTPNRIGKLAGDKERCDEVDELEKTQDSRLGRKIVYLDDIQRLTRGGYDIRQKMGTLLRGRFKFTTLRGIREAYSTAFSEREKKARPANIDKALADKAIDTLCIIRNIIVHKAGIADQEYEERAKVCPLAPQVRKGQAIPLDGGICIALIRPVMDCCLALVSAVDSWLTLLSREVHA
jgi:hypothetical protein